MTFKTGTFESLLREAIQAEFGSSVAFSRALGVSRSRVSQLTGGSSPPDPTTLERILRTFSSPSWQEQIHSAWIRQFVPVPTEEIQGLDTEDGRQLASRLWLADAPEHALHVANLHRARTTDAYLWQELSGIILLVNLRLGRAGASLVVGREMIERASNSHERGHLLTALWMQGVAARNVEHVGLDKLNVLHTRALDVASAITATGEWQRRLKTKRLELMRDFALHVLKVSEHRRVPTGALEKAVASVNQAIERWDDEQAAALGLEVRARLEVALGQVVKAEETLSEIRNKKLGRFGEIDEKMELVEARIAILRGEVDRARTALQQICERCLVLGNYHHFRVADQLLAQLELGDL